LLIDAFFGQGGRRRGRTLRLSDCFGCGFFGDGAIVHDVFIEDDVFDEVQLFFVDVFVDLVEIIIDFAKHYSLTYFIQTYTQLVSSK
jgi:hypothetical protein